MRTLTMLLAIGVAASFAAGELITNGGFETGDTSGWTQSAGVGGSAVVASDGNAHSGTYYLILRSPDSDAWFTQDLTAGLVDGTEYVLSFWYRNVADGTENTWRQARGGMANNLGFTTPGFITGANELISGATDADWQQYTVTWVEGTDASPDGFAWGSQGPVPDRVLWLDDVSVEVVPEPASLSVLGLGALALIRRRR